jgi:CRP-like cAMP-binding protein
VSSRRRIAEHLAAVPLFATCSKRDRSIIARHTEEVELPAGTTIISEGDPGDAFYVLVDGRATITRRGRLLQRAMPGSWFGELALLDAAPRNATVVADTEVRLAVLGARIFAVLLKEMPNMSDKLMRALARRLREADERSVQ